MSHPQQIDFVTSVKNQFPQFFDNQKVLEVGSYNINGSVRPLFTNCEYLGIDVGEGKDVDLVAMGHTFDAPDSSFDVTISCECFEHNPEWIATFQNMIRMTRSGGLVLMTAATTGREEHGTSRTTPINSPHTVALGWDYYKNLTVQDFTDNFNLRDFFSGHVFQINPYSCDIYFYGIRK